MNKDCVETYWTIPQVVVWCGTRDFDYVARFSDGGRREPWSLFELSLVAMFGEPDVGETIVETGFGPAVMRGARSSGAFHDVMRSVHTGFQSGEMECIGRLERGGGPQVIPAVEWASLEIADAPIRAVLRAVGSLGGECPRIWHDLKARSDQVIRAFPAPAMLKGVAGKCAKKALPSNRRPEVVARFQAELAAGKNSHEAVRAICAAPEFSQFSRVSVRDCVRGASPNKRGRTATKDI